ncbi:hypothetical protein B0H13DRAFT_2272266 [Mycena leptocephala]|nr:hypothetical protein B0H13DRAFT_2272266 [Mycena leptocephala]
MRLLASLLLVTPALLAHAQADAVSVNGLSSVARPTDPALSPPALLILGSDVHPRPHRRHRLFEWERGHQVNKGKIAGGVIAALAVLLALLLTTAFLIRRRSKNSTTHWRNRVGGWTWQHDTEGSPNSPGAGAAKFAPSGVGKREGMGQVPKPLISQPLVGYDYWQDIKAPVTSPVQPLFVREPRIGVDKRAEAVEGHKRQGSRGSK